VFNYGDISGLVDATENFEAAKSMTETLLALEVLRCATIIDVKGTLSPDEVSALVRCTPRAHTLRVLGGEWTHAPRGWGVRRLISFAATNIVDAPADIEVVIVGLKLHQRYAPRRVSLYSPCSTPRSSPSPSHTSSPCGSPPPSPIHPQTEYTKLQSQEIHFLFPTKDTHGYDLSVPPPPAATERQVSFTRRAIHDVLVYAFRGLARGQPHFLVGLTEYHPAWLGMHDNPDSETIKRRFADYVFNILRGPGMGDFREERLIADRVVFQTREEHALAHADYALHRVDGEMPGASPRSVHCHK